MRNAQGYAIITDPFAPLKEIDTFTCCHCNGIVFVKPPPEPMTGGFCMMCMKHICNSCCDHGCTPFEKKLEQIENRARTLKSMGF